MAEGVARNERRLDERHILRLERTYGIPRSVAEAAGLFSADTPDEVARYVGSKPPEGGGIVIPYGGGYYRVRLDVTYTDKDGDTVKYLAPKGRGNRLYVPPSVDLSAPALVITEGEFKALCAAARGIPCVAVAGIDSWRRKSDAGEKLPVDEALLPELQRDWRGQQIFLIYDSDITPAHPRWVTYGELAEQLYRHGAEVVKVITLPKLEGIDSKVGLDDYLLTYERLGQDGVARFWSLVEHTPPWLPVKDGAEHFAARELASADVERQVRGAAALLGRYDDLIARAKLKAMEVKNLRALWKEAKKYLSAALARQAPAPAAQKAKGATYAPRGQSTGAQAQPQPGGGSGGNGGGQQAPQEDLKKFAELFPPAAGTPFADYPVPPGWTIDDAGRVCREGVERNGAEVVEPVLACVAALAGVMVPAEEGEDMIYDLWWYRSDHWEKLQVPAGTLFNANRFDYLANHGVPVDSNNAKKVVSWLAALRDLAITRPGVAKLPVKVLVYRSGWHRLGDGTEVFSVGKDIYTRGGRLEGEGGDPLPGDPEERATEWGGVSPGEQQMLAAIRAGGTYERQLEVYLKYLHKYPLAAFFTGAGAAGPIMRYLKDGGESDVAGFVVESADPESGRGKTTLNMFPAGLWGKPAVGEMIRTANRTAVHSEVLFTVHCDISTHIDESQLIRYADVLSEIIYGLSQGMGRERASKSGGGRRTRYYYTVLVVSAERSVLDVVGGRQGIFDRVISLPPLFPAKREEYRVEAERIAKELNSDFGHLGRRYVEWLISFPPDLRREMVMEAYRAWKERFDAATDMLVPVNAENDGSSEKNQTLKRLAKRAAACVAGLELLLRSAGVGVDEATAICGAAASEVWEHVAANTEGQAFLSKVLNVIRSFVAENEDAVRDLKPTDRKPPRWIGRVVVKDGKKYIALYPNQVAEALKRYAGVEYETAVKALRAAGLLLCGGDGKKDRNAFPVWLNSKTDWCLTIAYDALFPPSVGVLEGKGGGSGAMSNEEPEL